LLGVVFQGLADFSDGGVNAVFGIDEDILAPETVDDFLAGDYATLALQKKHQQLHGDALQFQGVAVAAQFEAVAVEFEFVEMVARAGHGAGCRPNFPTSAW
jgi:hypothetical protein